MTQWNKLTDEDRERAMKSMPDMLEGFLNTWGWLHFAKAIEDICKEKNAAPAPDVQPAIYPEEARQMGLEEVAYYTHPPAADVQPVGYFNGEFGSHDGNRIWFKVIASDAIPTAGSAIYAKELVCDCAAKDMPFGRCCKAPNFSTCKSKLQVDQWNINIRNSVDKLLEQAGFAPDSSVRHQLAMMKLSEGKIK